MIAEEGATEARVRKLIGLEHTAITWFLNQYLVDKERDGEHPDANADYGGFSAMVKDGAFEDFQITQRNATTWDFEFEQTIAGSKNLMRKLPLNARGEFTIEIGKPTNAEMERDAEWYRKAPWDAGTRRTCPRRQKETLTLAIKPRTRSRATAGGTTQRLFEDGMLTIDAHFGYDYNPEAAHLADSQGVLQLARSRGFKSPVSSWDKYTRTSGPLTRTLDADGKRSRSRSASSIRGPARRPIPTPTPAASCIERTCSRSLASRDVIVYSGHSGPLYGFALANWDKTDEGDVDDSELAVTPLAPATIRSCSPRAATRTCSARR